MAALAGYVCARAGGSGKKKKIEYKKVQERNKKTRQQPSLKTEKEEDCYQRE